MIHTFAGHTELRFHVVPPIYLPFYNEWGANAYYKYESFDLDPFRIRCSSTSGSPVAMTQSGFWGFLRDGEGRFAFDGVDTLTVTGEAGQELFYEESCDVLKAWETYGSLIRGSREEHTEDFWGGLEYVTWVDQKHEAKKRGTDNWEPLTEDYVLRYMERVEKLGLPKGKLTIDDGWMLHRDRDGNILYGDWDPDPAKFPDMGRMVKEISDAGFIPALWFAPFTATPNSRLLRAHPELTGEPFGGESEFETGRRLMLLRPDECLREYYRKAFRPYVEMGFRKFKMDMAYGPKKDMKALLEMIYTEIKSMDPAVEIEAHMPDIFFMPYCDTVRMNDVAFDEAGRWRGVTMEHYKVCRYSAHGKLLNLDHLGTNDPDPDPDLYLEHTRMLLRLPGGYPCVSLLPDRFGGEVEKAYVEAVRGWKRT